MALPRKRVHAIRRRVTKPFLAVSFCVALTSVTEYPFFPYTRLKGAEKLQIMHMNYLFQITRGDLAALTFVTALREAVGNARKFVDYGISSRRYL